jgi:hypothetical protein
MDQRQIDLFMCALSLSLFYIERLFSDVFDIVAGQQLCRVTAQLIVGVFVGVRCRVRAWIRR